MLEPVPFTLKGGVVTSRHRGHRIRLGVLIAAETRRGRRRVLKRNEHLNQTDKLTGPSPRKKKRPQRDE